MSTTAGDRRVYLQELGKRLRQLREGLGLVLQDVADLFGTSRNVPSQWEGGLREPSYDTLLRLADFYGVTTDWLLGREGAEKDGPRVRDVKRQLREYLRLRTPTLPRTAPDQRLKLAVDFLMAQDPVMFSLERLSRQLLVSEEAFRQVLVGGTMITGPLVQRFAQFANLPELWFYHPEPQLDDPLEKYRSVVERFQVENLTPGDVELRMWGGRRRARRQA